MVLPLHAMADLAHVAGNIRDSYSQIELCSKEAHAEAIESIPKARAPGGTQLVTRGSDRGVGPHRRSGS